MKILQIACSLRSWGGIERYIVYQSQGLIDRGHEVHLACPGNVPLASKFPGPVHSISLRSKYDLSGAWQLRELARTEKFEIAIAHFSPDFLLSPQALKMGCNAKVVLTRHLALPWNKFKSKLYSQRSDLFVGVSQAVAECLACTIPASKLTFFHAGVPTPKVATPRDSFLRSANVEPNSLVVGYFGRLAPEKGVHVLIEAVNRLDHCSCLIVGDGPERKKLEKMSNPNRIRFFGRVEDVNSAMNAVDVVVIPSVWQEAFPFSGLEAIALEKPLIASKIGGLPEMVRHNETGFLVPHGDPTALFEALVSFPRDADQRNRLRNSIREIWADTFSVEQFARRSEACFLSLLS